MNQNPVPVQLTGRALTAWQVLNAHGPAADILVATTMILEAVARLSEQSATGFNQAAEVLYRVAESPDQIGTEPLRPVLRACIRELGHHFHVFAVSFEAADRLEEEERLQRESELPPSGE